MKFFDLFAGIGGFRLGLEQAGHECVGFCEYDKHARKSYKNIHNTENEVEWHDITSVSDEQFRTLRGTDIITAGFPCQSFSVAGERRGFSDTRGIMFFEIARAAEQIKPRILFLENVKGLLNSKTPMTFYDIMEVINHEIVGGTLWEEKFSPISNWNILRNNISHYLSDKLQMNSVFQNLKLDTSLKKNSKLVYEMTEEEVEVGLMKRLKYLETQISQTTKKRSDYQKELMQRLGDKGEGWDLILKKLFSIESLNMADISMLEKAIVINGEIESLLNKKSAENSNPMKSFTTSTELKRTIDQKICTFVQELNTLLFIIKQWKLSTNLWKRIMSDLMKKKEGMYYVGTFNIIINTLSELGYDCEYQVLNSENFGVPQNRERVFIIGRLRGTGGREVFPIGGESTNALEFAGMLDVKGNDEVRRVYKTTGVSPSLTTMQGGNRQPKIIHPVLTPNRENKRQNGRRFKENGDPMFTLTGQDRHGLYDGYTIRKLTPKECWRLQGFPDWAFEKAAEVNSDSQLYKQAGNAVTVNVVYDIARCIE